MIQTNLLLSRSPALAHLSYLTVAFACGSLGCSDGAVNMGEDVEVAEPAPLVRGEGCRDSTTLQASLISVRNQDDLDALEGCEVFDGDFQIAHFEGADLRPLRSLRTITGVFRWYPIEAFEGDPIPIASLEGLDALESVGDLELGGFTAANVDPFRNLKELTRGRLAFDQCPNLTNLDGLSNLQGIHDLELHCPALESMNLSLPYHMKNLAVSEATGLGELPELGVVDISGRLSIYNTALRNLDAFALLEHAGSVGIGGNPLLENVDALDGLQDIESLTVAVNPSLVHLPPFSRLARLSSLTIEDNDALLDLPQLVLEGSYLPDRVAAPYRLHQRVLELTIRGNAALSKVALSEGWTTGLVIVIDDNPSLTELSFTRQWALDYLAITNNPALGSITLGKLARVDELEVLDNPLLDTSIFEPVVTFLTRMYGNANSP